MDAIDLSLYTAVPSPQQLDCLRRAGVYKAIIGTRGNAHLFPRQADAFLSRGIAVECYPFLYATEPGAAQAQAMLRIIKPFPVVKCWLDVEKDPRTVAQPPPAVWRQCLRDARAVTEDAGYAAGIYTSISMWNLTGNTTEHSDLDLWEARWRFPSGNPGGNFLPPLPFEPFGGWTERTMVQYAGDQHFCSLNLDLNYIERMENDMKSEPIAPWWTGRSWGPPGRGTMRVDVDCRGIPPNAKAVDVNVMLRLGGGTGELTFFHGDGRVAGVVSQGDRPKRVRIIPSAPGPNGERTAGFSASAPLVVEMLSTAGFVY